MFANDSCILWEKTFHGMHPSVVCVFPKWHNDVKSQEGGRSDRL